MSTVIQSPSTVATVTTPGAPPVSLPVVAPPVVVAAPQAVPLSPSTASALGVPVATNPQDEYLNNLLAVDPSSTSYLSNSNLSDSGWSSGWSFSRLFSFSWIDLFVYVIKLGILFGLIFLFTSVIPEQELELITRLLIAGTVVLFYAMLDVFRQVLASIKAAICLSACGCS